ncbi:unnamed protein product [Pleuronectes platessa]|uniref:Uncharacterized protein n=1 Tax=Pleuronectes platessa TaxID=8262 RepID=A0A9N7USV1_PLEPL|nr:unnamed protein product [Pleuronectes platessa]
MSLLLLQDESADEVENWVTLHPSSSPSLSNLKPQSVEAQVARWANDWVSNCCKAPSLLSASSPPAPPPHQPCSLSLQRGESPAAPTGPRPTRRSLGLCRNERAQDRNPGQFRKPSQSPQWRRDNGSSCPAPPPAPRSAEDSSPLWLLQPQLLLA